VSPDNLSPAFESADTWILLALIYGGGLGAPGATLRDLLSAADYLNHAIPTRLELDGALNRLLAAGCLRGADGRYQVTPAVAAYYQGVSRPGRQTRRDWDDMEKFIAGLPPLQACPRRVTIGEDEYAVALADYLMSF
jgi:hypothetical protein